MTEPEIDILIQDGAAAYERGEYSREVQIWKQVAILEPDNPRWQANLAHALANVGELEQAEILFQHAMSCVPRLSAAFNNYVAMHTRHGAELSEMLPFLILSLEASENYEYFQRHLLNVAAAFALADRPANDAVWTTVRERSLDFLERVEDRTLEHEQFVDSCIQRFAKYDTLKTALSEQNWDSANRALVSLAQDFADWSYGYIEVRRIRHFHPLLSAAIRLFAILEKLGSDTDYGPSKLRDDVGEAYGDLQKLADIAPVYGSRSLLDLLGWTIAELHRQSQWLADPTTEYDAEAHSTPSAHLLALSTTAYAELAEMLQALLVGFNRTIRRTRDRLASARTSHERSEVLDHAWRAIRVSAHGIVGEYKGLSECLGREMLGWNTTPRDRLSSDIGRFKSLVESRIHPDLYVGGKPQEQVGRAVLLAFLHDRGFSEVPIRGGRVDVLVVRRDENFVIELKIWRGAQYHDDGIAELQEYVRNDGLPSCGGATYVVLDPTSTGKATEHVKATPRPDDIDIVVVNIKPPAPSKVGEQKRRQAP